MTDRIRFFDGTLLANKTTRANETSSGVIRYVFVSATQGYDEASNPGLWDFTPLGYRIGYAFTPTGFHLLAQG